MCKGKVVSNNYSYIVMMVTNTRHKLQGCSIKFNMLMTIQDDIIKC